MIKKSAKFDETVQLHIDDMNFDKVLMEAREKVGHDEDCIVDYEKIEEYMFDGVGKEKSRIMAMQSEYLQYRSMSLIGFKHGRQFSGLVPGALPTVSCQLDGTRAMAMASVSDVCQQPMWLLRKPL